ncbi:MAG: hypothetical protein LKE54_04400 [Prevotella sp.]|jgi:hypothetical protein|nr:hypothetical protein [Prevotella sp.]MCH3994283.1 hypothetical protein [Prevotella sp.]
MSNNYSAIHRLYAYQDGDTITPAMGVQIDTGYGLMQYWNPTTKKVVNTDFSVHHPTLYPQPYSSQKGTIVVPEISGQQWYYNNISNEGAILDNGVIKAKFSNLFKVGTVVVNGNTYPCLIIIGNLATEDDHTDKYIYYNSTYEGKSFTCQQLIPVQSSVGDAYSVLVSVEGEDGSGDNVLSNDNDWIKYTFNLQLAGQNVSGSMSYAFQKLNGSVWQDISNITSLTEISNNNLKVYNAAVEGVELFRVKITYGGKDYYATVEATDVHDPYYVDDGCNIAGDAVKEGEIVTFNPHVYDRSSGEISTGWGFDYTLTKKTDGSIISDFDEKSLTYEHIKAVGGVLVRIEAIKS